MHRLTIYLLALGVFLTATSELVVSGVLPAIAADLDVSIALAGQLISAYSLAFAVGTPLLVTLTSRLGRKRVLIGALAAYVAGCIAAAASFGFAALVVSRLVLGASSGVFLVVALGAAAKLVPADKLGGAIGTVVLGFSGAMVLGVPIGIAITGRLGWQAIFVLLAALALAMTYALLRLLPDVPGDDPIPFRRQLRVLGSAVVVAGLLLTLFRETGGSVLLTYIAPYLQQTLGMTPSGVGVTLLTLGIVGAFGSRLGGWAADNWGYGRLLLAGLLLHTAMLALLPAATAVSGWIALLLIGLMMLAMFATAPAIQTLFIRQAPESANLALSLNLSVVHVGLSAGAGAGGLWVDAAAPVRTLPWLASVIVAFGLAMALVCLRLNSRRQSRSRFP